MINWLLQSAVDNETKHCGAQSPLALLLLLVSACERAPQSPPAISLVHSFGEAEVTDSPTTPVEFPRLELGFDDQATVAPPEGAGETRGWWAIHGATTPRLVDGRLVSRGTDEFAILAVAIPEGELPSDLLGAMEIDLEISAGTQLGVLFTDDEEITSEMVEELLYYIDDRRATADLLTDLRPGKRGTYRLTEADAPDARPTALERVRHLALAFFDAGGAEISLGSMRITTRSQHLAEIPAGIGWHQLGDIYRETIVTRSPEAVTWKEVKLGRKPWLAVAVGSPEPHPATYRVEVAAEGAEAVVLERTVTVKDSWHPIALDLAPLAGRAVEIRFSLASEEEGRIGFWGSPAIHHRGAEPEVVDATPARAELSETGAPRGVILMIADTLRSDHLDAWGYERPTAPFLAELAAEGVRFQDNVSQGPATKVSVPSILTSLYPSTTGVFHLPDRVPASVTTLTEAFREAGYTTFHTSSVIFTGRNSNLQQGVEVLHERASIKDLGSYRSKTARTYVDRLIRWLETHHQQPFFVLLHVFDPHSPFRPFEPYDRRWMDAETLAAHETNVEKIIEIDAYRWLPGAEDLAKAGVEAEEWVEATHAWYDASIRAMDVEVKRLFERLEEHGIADDVLFAFVADHGEEFLEHGEKFHGHSVYGDLINVPLFVRWPGVVPAGRVVERTTQSIDLMPTLLELARVPVPTQVQGRSLVPLMIPPDSPEAYGGGRAPVFAERRSNPHDEENDAPDAYTVIHDGRKLIWNVVVRDDRPELELFDHRADPLNLTNLADEQPEKVAELKGLIERWRAEVEAAKVSDDGLAEELSAAEIEQLKALGYVN